MRRGWRVVAAAALGAVLSPAAASAQTHLEVRWGFDVGSHTATAAALEMVPEPSYGALVLRQVRPSLALFAGYLRTGFGCREGFCVDRELTVAGHHGAVGAELRRGGAWARAGVLFGTTEVGTGGEAPEAGPGVMAAAGFTVGEGRVRLVPGVSWRWLSADTPSRSDHAVALGVDLGVSVRVGGG